MGKIVVTEFISLDGVIEAPGGGEEYKHAGWTFEFDRGEDGDAFKLDEVLEAEAQLLGRRTYEGFAAAWPSYADNVGFAQKMNTMPKYVVSKTLESADWENSTILSGDLVDDVTKLKNEVDMRACTRFVPATVRERNTRRGRIGLRPRAWRTTNAPRSATATPPSATVRVEPSP